MAKKKSAAKKRRKNRSSKKRNKRSAEPMVYESLEPKQLLATFVVNSTADLAVDHSDSVVTIRDAIDLANQNANVDTIAFSSSIANQTIELDLFTPPIIGDVRDTPSKNNLVIKHSLIIDGGNSANAADRIKIDADKNSRVFNFVGQSFGTIEVHSTPNPFIDGSLGIDPAIGKNLTLKNIELVNGRTFDFSTSTDTEARSGTRDGGAVRFNSTGTLKLENVRIAESETDNVAATGGAISAVGNVQLLAGTVIEENRTDGNRAHGGGVFSKGTVLVQDSFVRKNLTDGSGAHGGAIAAELGVTVIDSEMSDNRTSGNHSYGGAIYSGRNIYDVQAQTMVHDSALVTIDNSSILRNETFIKFSKGGAIFAADVTIQNGSLIEGNRTKGRTSFGGAIYALGHVQISDSTVHENYTNGEVSAFASFGCQFGMFLLDNAISSPLGTVTDTIKTVLQAINDTFNFIDLDPCPARANSGSSGGAVFAKSLTLSNSTVTDNYTDGPGAKGGAFFVRGELAIINSTITGNHTDQELSQGGAIAVSSNTPIQINGSLINNNYTAGTNSSGGAIWAGAGTIVQSEISNNQTDGENSGGGAIAGHDLIGKVRDVQEGSQPANSAIRSSDNYLTIINSILRDNQTLDERSAGGAVFGANEILIRKSVLANNSTAGDEPGGNSSETRLNRTSGGGAVAALEVIISNSTLNGNSTEGDEADGGAIWGEKVTVTNSTLVANHAKETGGDLSSGGAIYARQNVTANNSTFTGNRAGGYGGAIFAGTGGATQGTVVANNSLFLGNGALEGAMEIHADTLERRGISIIGDTTFSASQNLTVGSQTGSGSHFRADAADVFNFTNLTHGSYTLRAGLFAQSPSNNSYGGFAGGFEAGCSVAGCVRETIETIPLIDDVTNPAIDRTTIYGDDQRGISRLSDFPGAGGSGFSDIGSFEVTPPNVVTTHLSSAPGQTSLEDAISWADFKSPGIDTITFAPHLSGRTIILSDDIEIFQPVIIDASPLTARVAIQGVGSGASGRLLDFRHGTGDLTLKNLTFRGGNSTVDGGAIRSLSTGTVTFTNSILELNTTTTTSENGGAVAAADGTVILDQSHARNNKTTGSSSDGGAIFAKDVILRNSSSVVGNQTQGADSDGGGIFASGTVTIEDRGRVDSNSTLNSNADGGGIYAASVVVGDRVSIRNNKTKGLDADGGGIFSQGDVVVGESIIHENSTLQNDSSGGGIFSESGDITLDGTTVLRNRTSGNDSPGGGVFSLESLVVRNSLIDRNSTTGANSSGGGLHSAGAIATITNSTIAGNTTAGSAANGGGVYAAGTILTNSTVTGNSTAAADADFGGAVGGLVIELTNSIVLGNHSNKSTAPNSEIGSRFATTFKGNNIVGANSVDFDASVSPNVQNAPVNPGNTSAPTEDSVFHLTSPTRIDANADGVAETIATRPDSSQRLAGIVFYNGGSLGSVALAGQPFNTAIDGTLAPVSLFSFEGNANNGFGINGTFNGGLTTSASGIRGNAVEFTGNSSQFVQLNSALNIGNSSNTVELWVNIPANAPSSFMAFLSNFSSDSDSVYWGTDTSGRARVNWGSSNQVLNGTTDLRGNGWTHIAFVRDTNTDTLEIFVDGESENATTSAGLNITFSSNHRIGLSNTTGNPLTGTLDELTIHQRALSSEEIRVLANAFDSRGEGFDRVILPPGATGPAPRMDLGALETASALQEAKSLIVTTDVDSVDPFDGETSLREAINHANDPNFNGGDADGDGFTQDTITFAPLLGGKTISLIDGALEITQSAILDASTLFDKVTIDAGGNSRVIDVPAGSVDLELNNFRVTGGKTTTDGLDGRGGGIRFNPLVGTLKLTNTDVSGNETGGDIAHGGGVYAKGNEVQLLNSTIYGNRTLGGQAYGGGLYAKKRATITNSAIANNQTHGSFSGGAGLRGDYITTITNSTISGNVTHNGSGAGISVVAATLNNSTITSNVTSNSGSLGGGIYATSSLSINNSIVLGNHTQSGNDLEIATQGATVPVFGGNNLVGQSEAEFNVSVYSNVQNADVENVFATSTQLGLDTDGDGVVDLPIEGAFGGALSFNGGVVPTVQLNASVLNPALDASADSLVTSSTDARGFVRSFDLAGIANAGSNQIDLGAFEIQAGVQEANGLVVTTTSDVVDTLDFATSLREAVAFANANTDLDVVDTITFAANVGQTFENGNTITLTQGELLVTDSLVIDASSANNRLVIDADELSRVVNFVADSGNLDFVNVDLTNGRTIGDNANSQDTTFSGGAIRFLSDGTLTLTDSRVSDSRVDLASGGGIFAAGDVVLVNTNVQGNSISKSGGSGSNDLFGGGVFARTATLHRSTISSNSNAANRGNGGGLYASIAYIYNSTINSNSTTGIESVGGGIAGQFLRMDQTTVAGNTTTGGGAVGGGVYTARDAYIYSSTFSGNTTSGGIAGGGAIAAGHARIFNSILLGNATFNAGGDEIGGTNQGNAVSFYGQNIVGTDAARFDASGISNVENANIFFVFKQTSSVGGGVFKGHLSSNGGPVKTIALRGNKSNPALDVADDNFLLQTDRDARASLRRFDLLGFNNDITNTADLGAYELGFYDENTLIQNSLEVTTDVGDGDPFDGETNLREAVLFANSLEEPSTVTFASDAGETFNVPATIALTQGELEIDSSLTVDGSGTGGVTIDAGGISRIFNVESSSGNEVALKRLSLVNGFTPTVGGAILFDGVGGGNLVLDEVSISNSSANGGGGAFLGGTTSFQIFDSAISNNQANFGGSGILAGGSSKGWIVNSTVSGNTSTNGNGAIQQQATGSSTLELRNVTVANNTGVGVVNYSFASGDATLEVGNSIIADNSGVNLANFGSGSSTFNSVGHNISDDGSAGFTATGDQPNTDPQLDALANNGGLSETHAIESNSVAVDAGDQQLVENIFKPTSTTSSTSGDDFFPITNVIANNSITRGNYSTLPDNSGSWVTAARNGATGDYFDNLGDPNPVLTFDLGETALLSEVAIWGYSLISAQNNDVKEFTLEFSIDGGATFSNPITLDKAKVSAANIVDTIGFDRTYAANFVRMTITDNHFSTGQAGGDRVGFDEIRFLTTLRTDQRGEGFDRIVDGEFDGSTQTDVGAFELRSRLIVDAFGDLDDGNESAGNLTLREAVRLANTSPGHDTIAFDENVFSVNDTINLTSQLLVTDSVTITGPSDYLAIDGSDSTRLFRLGSSDAATYVFENIALVNGDAGTSTGGAILLIDADDTLVVRGVEFSGNSANGGGAITTSGSDYVIENSSFIVNHANFNGSAVLATGNSEGYIVNSTFSQNTSGSGGGVVFVQTAADEIGSLRIRNSTITSNTGHGVQAVSSTDGTSVIEIGNSIVSANSGSNATASGLGIFDVASLGFNISDDGSTQFDSPNDLTNTDPLLDIGDYNGGNTITHALLPNSLAIDGGNDLLAEDADGNPLTTDQRGLDRFVDGKSNGTTTVDIGAVEFQNSAPIITGIKVGSPSWHPNFVSAIDADSEGFPLVLGSNQLDDIPFTNATQLLVTFDQPVTGSGGAPLAPADFSLIGSSTLNNSYNILSVQFLTNTNTAVLTLDAPLTKDKLLLSIEAGNIVGSSGILDGEFETNVSLKSGDGEAGGDFNFRFEVLPGNVNNDFLTSTTDISLVRGLGTQIVGVTPGFNARANVNGDVLVNSTDISAIRALGTQFIQNLQEPAISSGTVVTSQPVTSQPVTTQSVTSQPITLQSVTSAEAAEPVSANSVTSNLELPNSPETIPIENADVQTSTASQVTNATTPTRPASLVLENASSLSLPPETSELTAVKLAVDGMTSTTGTDSSPAALDSAKFNPVDPRSSDAVDSDEEASFVTWRSRTQNSESLNTQNELQDAFPTNQVSMETSFSTAAELFDAHPESLDELYDFQLEEDLIGLN